MPKSKAKPLLERKTRAMPQRPQMATVGIILVGLGHDRMLQNNELILDVMTLGVWQVRAAKQTNKQIKKNEERIWEGLGCDDLAWKINGKRKPKHNQASTSS